MNTAKLFRVFFLLGLLAFSSCARHAEANPPASALQLQKSVALAAGRYVSIYEKIASGKGDEGQKDLDYWVDMSILELSALGNAYPDSHLDEVRIDSESDLPIKAFYRRLAQYRGNHQRIHINSMTPAELQAIDRFIQKYK
jgi:hypothetical protein